MVCFNDPKIYHTQDGRPWMKPACVQNQTPAGRVDEYLLVRLEIEIHGRDVPHLRACAILVIIIPPGPQNEYKSGLAWMNGTTHCSVIQPEPVMDVLLLRQIEGENRYVGTLTEYHKHSPLHGHRQCSAPRTKIVGQGCMWHPTHQMEEVVVHRIQ